METVPPRRTASNAVSSASNRSVPAFIMSGSASLSGSRPTTFCTALMPPEPCASMPTASMTASAPRPLVLSRAKGGDAGGVEPGAVEGLRAAGSHSLQPLGDQVRDQGAVAAVQGDPGGHVAVRPGAEPQHGALSGEAGA